MQRHLKKSTFYITYNKPMVKAENPKVTIWYVFVLITNSVQETLYSLGLKMDEKVMKIEWKRAKMKSENVKLE